MCKNKKAFTLIELLVTIAIIGILSAIVMVSLNGPRQKARDAKRISDIKQIQLALELYNEVKGEYPDPPLSSTLAPTYIASVPTDPQGGVYPYDNYTDSSRASCTEAGGTCRYYHLGAKFEQGAGSATGPLSTDRDVDVAQGTGPDGVSTVAACGADPLATTATDLCFDVTP